MMRPRFTNAGRALQLRALAGVQLTFTKMQLGDGQLGETDYQTLTSLISPKATLSLSGIKIADGSATVRGEFNNANMTDGFYYRELGLFAKDPDNPSNEILYCYANFGDECQYIAEPTSALISRTVRIVATVDDAPNVTAILNDNAQYVDREELMLAIEQHNQSESAHQNLLDFDVTYYIDPLFDDEDLPVDGSAERPFFSIQDAVDAIPLTALRVRLVLQSGNTIYLAPDDEFRSFQRIEIVFEDAEAIRPVIMGHLHFADCGVVRVQNLIFQAAASEDASPAYLRFANCGNAELSRVRGQLLASDGTFVDVIRSTVSIVGLETISVFSAVHAFANSFVFMQQATISGGTYGITSAAGSFVSLSAVGTITDTAATPLYGGVIMQSDTAADITDGTVHTHVHSTENPHNTSLTQAQVRGGTVNVEHGGTGQTTFDLGALLKGNGTGGIEQILGVGALYALLSGSPQFGTLPISAGGTGMTTDGLYIQAADAQHTVETGVQHGSIKLAGGRLLIAWGKINSAGQETFVHSFSVYNQATFANTNYVLTFSGQDDVWGSITKGTDSFSIPVGGVSTGRYVADWIAVGLAAEEGSAS